MNLVAAARELDVLKERLTRLQLITGSGQRALEDLQTSAKSKLSQGQMTDWTLKIEPDPPLEFRTTSLRSTRLRLQVDLYGELSAMRDGLPVGKHSITIRVWALEKRDWFDAKMDAPELVEAVENRLGRRVILRFRFDCGDLRSGDPCYHMQFGGQQEQDEYFRMSNRLELPRFQHSPMNLLLACEFVVRHFYPEDYKALSGERSWQDARTTAQRNYIWKFLRKIRTYEDDYETSFLEYCWRP